jgi:hypothetical protein
MGMPKFSDMTPKKTTQYPKWAKNSDKVWKIELATTSAIMHENAISREDILNSGCVGAARITNEAVRGSLTGPCAWFNLEVLGCIDRTLKFSAGGAATRGRISLG